MAGACKKPSTSAKSCSAQSKEATLQGTELPPVQGKTGGPSRRSVKGGWTETEDESLRRAVAFHGGKNWKLIAEYCNGRTDVQCLHRWQKVLNPDVVKGPWSQEEDAKIRQLVQKYGIGSWSLIAQELPGRIGKQCRERWYNHLDPSIKSGEWTLEEDAILVQKHSIHGNAWSKIAPFLPGRANNNIKNRWNATLKRRVASGDLHIPSQEDEEMELWDLERFPTLASQTSVLSAHPSRRSQSQDRPQSIDRSETRHSELEQQRQDELDSRFKKSETPKVYASTVVKRAASGDLGLQGRRTTSASSDFGHATLQFPVKNRHKRARTEMSAVDEDDERSPSLLIQSLTSGGQMASPPLFKPLGDHDRAKAFSTNGLFQGNGVPTGGNFRQASEGGGTRPGSFTQSPLYYASTGLSPAQVYRDYSLDSPMHLYLNGWTPADHSCGTLSSRTGAMPVHLPAPGPSEDISCSLHSPVACQATGSLESILQPAGRQEDNQAGHDPGFRADSPGEPTEDTFQHAPGAFVKAPALQPEQSLRYEAPAYHLLTKQSLHAWLDQAKCSATSRYRQSMPHSGRKLNLP